MNSIMALWGFQSANHCCNKGSKSIPGQHINHVIVQTDKAVLQMFPGEKIQCAVDRIGHSTIINDKRNRKSDFENIPGNQQCQKWKQKADHQ